MFTLLLCSMPLKDCSILNSSSPVTLNPFASSHRKTMMSNVCVSFERASQRLRIRNCLQNFLESNSFCFVFVLSILLV